MCDVHTLSLNQPCSNFRKIPQKTTDRLPLLELKLVIIKDGIEVHVYSK